jgi:hypothetical protein
MELRHGLFLLPLAQNCHGLNYNRLNADGEEPGIGGDQGVALSVTGLAPEWITPPQDGLGLFEPAMFDHLADGHPGGRADWRLGQWERQIALALGGSGQDQALGFGEFGHATLY